LLTGGHSPSWSPDGQKIVFTNENDIKTINVDGSGETKLTDDTEGDGIPMYSPDGTTVAYQHDISTSYPCNRQLRIINVNTKAIVDITDGSSSDMNLCWSPDGTKIAFFSNRDGVEYSLYIYDLDDASIKRLTDKTYYADNDSAISWTR
jgi:TolB protein